MTKFSGTFCTMCCSWNRPEAVEDGAAGVLRLGFEAGRDRTRLSQRFSHGMLHVGRALYPDPAWPGMAYVYVVSLGGGVVGGDRFEVELRVARGARAHVTTQAATRLFRADGAAALSRITLWVEAGGVLEYVPDPVIPYAGSAFRQVARAYVHPEARLLWAEVLASGRAARGERFAFRQYESRFELLSPEGSPRATDALVLQPGQLSTTSPAVLGSYSALGSVTVVDPFVAPSGLSEAIWPRLASLEGMLAGMSRLPDGGGVTCRIVGPGTAEVVGAVRAVWDAVRRLWSGNPAPDLRKY